MIAGDKNILWARIVPTTSLSEGCDSVCKAVGFKPAGLAQRPGRAVTAMAMRADNQKRFIFWYIE